MNRHKVAYENMVKAANKNLMQNRKKLILQDKADVCMHETKKNNN